MNMPEDKIEVERNDERNTDVSIELDDVTNDALRLRELLVRETDLLKRMKIKEVGDMHEEKLNLIRRLEIRKQLLERDPSALDGKSDEGIKRFKDASEGIDEIIRENFHEVLKAKEINQRVVEVVFNKVMESQAESLGYGKGGDKGISLSGKDMPSPSIAVDKSI